VGGGTFNSSPPLDAWRRLHPPPAAHLQQALEEEWRLQDTPSHASGQGSACTPHHGLLGGSCTVGEAGLGSGSLLVLEVAMPPLDAKADISARAYSAAWGWFWPCAMLDGAGWLPDDLPGMQPASLLLTGTTRQQHRAGEAGMDGGLAHAYDHEEAAQGEVSDTSTGLLPLPSDSSEGGLQGLDTPPPAEGGGSPKATGGEAAPSHHHKPDVQLIGAAAAGEGGALAESSPRSSPGDPPLSPGGEPTAALASPANSSAQSLISPVAAPLLQVCVHPPTSAWRYSRWACPWPGHPGHPLALNEGGGTVVPATSHVLPEPLLPPSKVDVWMPGAGEGGGVWCCAAVILRGTLPSGKGAAAVPAGDTPAVAATVTLLVWRAPVLPGKDLGDGKSKVTLPMHSERLSPPGCRCLCLPGSRPRWGPLREAHPPLVAKAWQAVLQRAQALTGGGPQTAGRPWWEGVWWLRRSGKKAASDGARSGRLPASAKLAAAVAAGGDSSEDEGGEGGGALPMSAAHTAHHRRLARRARKRGGSSGGSRGGSSVSSGGTSATARSKAGGASVAQRSSLGGINEGGRYSVAGGSSLGEARGVEVDEGAVHPPLPSMVLEEGGLAHLYDTDRWGFDPTAFLDAPEGMGTGEDDVHDAPAGVLRSRWWVLRVGAEWAVSADMAAAMQATGAAAAGGGLVVDEGGGDNGTEKSVLWLAGEGVVLPPPRAAARRASLASTAPLPRLTKGVMGLSNIGNTCYMNAVVQCLGHTPLLREYLALGIFRAHLNRSSPLGTGGALTSELAAVLAASWGGRYRSRAPRALKAAVSRHKPWFAGREQHDAVEFMTALLDAVHEDTNRVTAAQRAQVLTQRSQQRQAEAAREVAAKAAAAAAAASSVAAAGPGDGVPEFQGATLTGQAHESVQQGEYDVHMSKTPPLDGGARGAESEGVSSPEAGDTTVDSPQTPPAIEPADADDATPNADASASGTADVRARSASGGGQGGLQVVHEESAIDTSPAPDCVEAEEQGSSQVIVLRDRASSGALVSGSSLLGTPELRALDGALASSQRHVGNRLGRSESLSSLDLQYTPGGRSDTPSGMQLPPAAVGLAAPGAGGGGGSFLRLPSTASLLKHADLAQAAWLEHVALNSSVVVDLMQGQYQARTQCDSCAHASLQFQSFMSLNLPIPTHSTMPLLVGVHALNNGWPQGRIQPHGVWVLPPMSASALQAVGRLAGTTCHPIDEQAHLAEGPFTPFRAALMVRKHFTFADVASRTGALLKGVQGGSSTPSLLLAEVDAHRIVRIYHNSGQLAAHLALRDDVTVTLEAQDYVPPPAQPSEGGALSPPAVLAIQRPVHWCQVAGHPPPAYPMHLPKRLPHPPHVLSPPSVATGGVRGAASGEGPPSARSSVAPAPGDDDGTGSASGIVDDTLAAESRSSSGSSHVAASAEDPPSSGTAPSPPFPGCTGDGVPGVEVGDRVDARDKDGGWYPATVVCVWRSTPLQQASGGVGPRWCVRLHFDGYSSKWDETHQLPCVTMAPLWTKAALPAAMPLPAELPGSAPGSGSSAAGLSCISALEPPPTPLRHAAPADRLVALQVLHRRRVAADGRWEVFGVPFMLHFSAQLASVQLLLLAAAHASRFSRDNLRAAAALVPGGSDEEGASPALAPGSTALLEHLASAADARRAKHPTPPGGAVPTAGLPVDLLLKGCAALEGGASPLPFLLRLTSAQQLNEGLDGAPLPLALAPPPLPREVSLTVDWAGAAEGYSPLAAMVTGVALAPAPPQLLHREVFAQVQGVLEGEGDQGGAISVAALACFGSNAALGTMPLPVTVLDVGAFAEMPLADILTATPAVAALLQDAVAAAADPRSEQASEHTVGSGDVGGSMGTLLTHRTVHEAADIQRRRLQRRFGEDSSAEGGGIVTRGGGPQALDWVGDPSRHISLAACLDSFTKSEHIPGWKCEKCGGSGGRRSLALWRLPDVLIIQLSRFRFTEHLREKLEHPIAFPLKGMDVAPWLAAPAPDSGMGSSRRMLSPLRSMAVVQGGTGGAATEGASPGRAVRSPPAPPTDSSIDAHRSPSSRRISRLLRSSYDLYAVANHHGQMGSGHYTAACLRNEWGEGGGAVSHTADSARPGGGASGAGGAAAAGAGSWVVFDDSRVTALPQGDKGVLPLAKGAAQGGLSPSTAYVLFYRRRHLSPRNIITYSGGGGLLGGGVTS